MIVHEHTVTATVDPNVVWDRWTQVDVWPVDNPAVRRARLNGPIAKGAGGWVKPEHGPRSAFRFAEVDRTGGRFVVEIKLLLCLMQFEHEMIRVGEPESHGDPQWWKLTHRVTLSGPLSRLWDRLMGREMAERMPAVVGRIAAIAAV